MGVGTEPRGSGRDRHEQPLGKKQEGPSGPTVHPTPHATMYTWPVVPGHLEMCRRIGQTVATQLQGRYLGGLRKGREAAGSQFQRFWS